MELRSHCRRRRSRSQVLGKLDTVGMLCCYHHAARTLPARALGPSTAQESRPQWRAAKLASTLATLATSMTLAKGHDRSLSKEGPTCSTATSSAACYQSCQREVEPSACSARSEWRAALREVQIRLGSTFEARCAFHANQIRAGR